jgi:hypothetical protein
VADGWCWFVLREKYCWLVADKPSEQGETLGATNVQAPVPTKKKFLFPLQPLDSN